MLYFAGLFSKQEFTEMGMLTLSQFNKNKPFFTENLTAQKFLIDPNHAVFKWKIN